MALSVQTIEREFCYSGMTLPDPNPAMSIADVQALHTAQYPELATAKPHVTQKATAEGTKEIVTFNIAVGTKG